MSERQYTVDKNGWVTAHFPDGGHLQEQSVSALLLFEILSHLERRGSNSYSCVTAATTDASTKGDGK